MSSFDASTHKLAGSNPSEAGGLLLKSSKAKSDSEGKEEAEFKKPSMSMLGLDRLARRKREERDAEAVNFPEKKARLQRRGEQSSDSNVRISFGKSSRSLDNAKDRKYRASLVETPSYTGGVSEDALQRMHSRLVGREQRSQGVIASSSSSRSKDRRGGSDGRREDR